MAPHVLVASETVGEHHRLPAHRPRKRHIVYE
jgi:hypothetical protein